MQDCKEFLPINDLSLSYDLKYDFSTSPYLEPEPRLISMDYSRVPYLKVIKKIHRKYTCSLNVKFNISRRRQGSPVQVAMHPLFHLMLWLPCRVLTIPGLLVEGLARKNYSRSPLMTSKTDKSSETSRNPSCRRGWRLVNFLRNAQRKL